MLIQSKIHSSYLGSLPQTMTKNNFLNVNVGWEFVGWELAGGNCPDGNYPGRELSGCELSRWELSGHRSRLAKAYIIL